MGQQTPEHSLLDQVPLPLAAIDIEGTQTFVNQAFCQLVGWSAADLIGEKQPFKYWPQRHLNEISTMLARFLHERDTKQGFECPLQDRAGNVFPVRINLSPTLRQGQTVGWIAAVTELSQEIEQKRQLVLREMQFRAITENLNEVLYLTDNHSGRILYISQSYERVWGASRESLYAHPTSYIDAMDSEYRALAINNFERQRKGESTRQEYRIRRPDGQNRWIDDQNYPFQEGGYSWTVGLATDITDRKSVENALRNSHEMLHIAQEVAELGSWNIDPSNQKCELTAGVFKILGHPVPPERDEATYLFKQDVEGFMSMLSSRIDETGMQRVREVLSGDGEIELSIVRDGGEPRRIHLRNRVTVPASGEAESISGVIQDVTEFHEKNELIAQLKKMDALGQLSGGLAHDLNNILGIVISNLEDTPAVDESNCSRHENVDAALVAAKRGSDIVQSLLAFARKRSSSEDRDMLVDEHIEDLLPMIRFVLGPRIHVVTRLDAAGCLANFDAALMDSSILNLVINARDAMSNGGALVIATARIPRRRTGTAWSRDSDHVEISIEDNGTGMPADVLARALEPYYTTKRKGSGTGLGLNMVHDFIKASRGTLHLASEPAVGTRVSVLLPITETPGPKSAASERSPLLPQMQAGRRKVVLFVDDEIALQRITRRILEKRGHEVHTAGSVDEARELLGRVPVQVLVTDIIMPGAQDGTALAQWAREHFPHIGIIGMSGNADLRKEFEVHGGLFLRKPVLNARLIEAVESLDVADSPGA